MNKPCLYRNRQKKQISGLLAPGSFHVFPPSMNLFYRMFKKIDLISLQRYLRISFLIDG